MIHIREERRSFIRQWKDSDVTKLYNKYEWIDEGDFGVVEEWGGRGMDKPVVEGNNGDEDD